jgi:hypothetical protein
MDSTEASAQIPETVSTPQGAGEVIITQDKPAMGLDEATSYRAEVEALLQQPDEAPVIEPEALAPVETPAPEVTAETEVDDAEEKAPDGTIPKRKHLNLSRMGEDKAKLVLFMERNPDVSVQEAMAKLGMLKSPEKETEQPVENDGPKTAQEAIAHLEQLRIDRKKSITEDLDFAKMASIDEQIERTKDLISSLKTQEVETLEKKQTEFESTATAAKAKAIELYPDVTNLESPLAKRMLEIDRMLNETNNPLLYDPNKAFRLTMMAANDLGISPKSKATAKVVSSMPTAKVRPALQPVSATARTTQSTSQASQIDADIDRVSSEDDYRAMLARL